MSDRWIVRRGTPNKGFTYVSHTGRIVRDRATIGRIERLRIPPAWRDVRIAQGASASVQAWGFDARGRRQYRYHERAVQRGQLRKYHRVRRMGTTCPRCADESRVTSLCASCHARPLPRRRCD